MALNPEYVLASDLQSRIVDKDTGQSLAAGTITTYEDNSRTTLKPIYTITGTPPDYSFVPLPNPLTLSAVGTVQDEDGNDIVPYWKPYDASGNIQLYYVVVKSEGEVLQFTREGWPNTSVGEDQNAAGFDNYIPNGQFLTHLNVVNTENPGEITEPVTIVAPGGWTFERPEDSKAIDIVTFDRFASYSINPSGNPRYAIKVENTDPETGNLYKDLRVKFQNVNRFSSDTQQYRFAFTGKSNLSGTVTVELILIKNYGTGGSSEIELSLGAFTLQTNYSIKQIAFIFGNNSGKTIGNNNDDYIQLAIRFPTDNLFSASLTDFNLMNDNGVITSYPQTTNADSITRTLAGWTPTPAYDGSDLYLAVKLGKNGFFFDHAEIGNVVMRSSTDNYVDSLSTTTNNILADGAQFETAAYSPLGIPFSRLQQQYFNNGNALNIPIYGTGAQYFSGVFSGSGAELRITNNSAGAVTNAADGTPATGFAFATIHTGATGYATEAYLITSNIFWLENLNIGPAAIATAETSGFTMGTQTLGNAHVRQVIDVTTVAASSLANPGSSGKYFNFESSSPFYVWYQITNETDPAPGGRTGIKINLTASDTAAIVAQKTRESLNGWQLTTVTTTAASTVPAGSYFSVNSTAESYYVWYKKDGVGTDPAPSGKIGIQVDILTADTNTQVATKTQIAINQKYFAVPDLRGYFLRGQNLSSGNDPDAATRWSLVPGVIGDMLGTFQNSQNLFISVSITIPATNQPAGPTAILGDKVLTVDESFTGVGQPLTYLRSDALQNAGQSEARPNNQYVLFAIKY